MVSPQGDSRRRVAEGYQLASECLSAALTMVLPTLGGLWLDNRWNCSPWLTIGGGALGMWSGLQQLMRLASSRGRRWGRGGGPAAPDLRGPKSSIPPRETPDPGVERRP